MVLANFIAPTTLAYITKDEVDGDSMIDHWTTTAHVQRALLGACKRVQVRVSLCVRLRAIIDLWPFMFNARYCVRVHVRVGAIVTCELACAIASACSFDMAYFF